MMGILEVRNRPLWKDEEISQLEAIAAAMNDGLIVDRDEWNYSSCFASESAISEYDYTEYYQSFNELVEALKK